MKSIFRNVALLMSLLALTTPSNGQGFLKKLKDAANNTTEKMNTAVEKAGSASVGAAVPRASGPTYYVSRSGSNKNDGLSPSTALKNIQKAIDLATDGSEIRVAEGNYFGLMNRGNIIIDKPLVILGGYSEDFSERDVLKHLRRLLLTRIPTVLRRGAEPSRSAALKSRPLLSSSTGSCSTRAMPSATISAEKAGRRAWRPRS